MQLAITKLYVELQYESLSAFCLTQQFSNPSVCDTDSVTTYSAHYNVPQIYSIILKIRYC